MKIVYLVTTLTLLLGLSACSQSLLGDFNESDDSAPRPPARAENGSSSEGPNDPEAGPNFQIIQSQVLDPSCVRCHSNAGGNRGGVNLETYASVLQNLRQVESTVIEDVMPPRKPLDPLMKELLLKWIQLGAPQ